MGAAIQVFTFIGLWEFHRFLSDDEGHDSKFALVLISFIIGTVLLYYVHLIDGSIINTAGNVIMVAVCVCPILYMLYKAFATLIAQMTDDDDTLTFKGRIMLLIRIILNMYDVITSVIFILALYSSGYTQSAGVLLGCCVLLAIVNMSIDINNSDVCYLLFDVLQLRLAVECIVCLKDGVLRRERILNLVSMTQ